MYYEAHDIGQEATRNATIITTRRKVMTIRGSDVDTNGLISKQDTLQVPRSANVVIGCSASLGNVPNAEGEFSVGFRSPTGILVGCQAATPTPRPGSPPPATKTCSSTLNTNLHPSIYTLYAMGSIEAGTTVSGTVTATLTESTPVTSTTLYKVVVGGARIRRMVDIASTTVDSLVSTYAYTVQKAGTAVSSGVLVTKPTYTFGYTVIDAISTGSLTYTPEFHVYVGIASSPHSGLGVTQGSHLGYKQVTITHLNGSIANGSTVYTYTSAANFPDHTSALLALEPVTSNDYRRGLLTQQRTFDASGHLLERVLNQYTTDLRMYHEIRGLVVRAVSSVHPQLQSQYPTYASGFLRFA